MKFSFQDIEYYGLIGRLGRGGLAITLTPWRSEQLDHVRRNVFLPGTVQATEPGISDVPAGDVVLVVQQDGKPRDRYAIRVAPLTPKIDQAKKSTYK